MCIWVCSHISYQATQEGNTTSGAADDNDNHLGADDARALYP